MAVNYSEVLNLTIMDLSRMEKEFNDHYEIIFKQANQLIHSAIVAKLKAHK